VTKESITHPLIPSKKRGWGCVKIVTGQSLGLIMEFEMLTLINKKLVNS